MAASKLRSDVISREAPYVSETLWVWEMNGSRGVRPGQDKHQWKLQLGDFHPQKLSPYYHKHSSILNRAAVQRQEKPEDDELVLLTRRLFAYALQDRKFVILNLDNLKLPGPLR
ncbi:hypothetical protein BDW62DRAFT_198929 [Aspergillus aurantiobrunneus]